MRHLLCCLLLGGLFQLSARAQDQTLPTEDNGFGFPLYIVVSITGNVGPVARDELLPAPLMTTLDKLLQERHLAKLDMGELMSSDRMVEYRAQFVFGTMSELRAWYTEASTQTLLEELKETGGGTALAINVERQAYAGAFRQQ